MELLALETQAPWGKRLSSINGLLVSTIKETITEMEK